MSIVQPITVKKEWSQIIDLAAKFASPILCLGSLLQTPSISLKSLLIYDLKILETLRSVSYMSINYPSHFPMPQYNYSNPSYGLTVSRKSPLLDSLPSRPAILQKMKSNFVTKYTVNNQRVGCSLPLAKEKLSPIEGYAAPYSPYSTYSSDKSIFDSLYKRYSLPEPQINIPPIPNEEGVGLVNKIVLERNFKVKNKIDLDLDPMSRIIKEHNVRLLESTYQDMYPDDPFSEIAHKGIRLYKHNPYIYNNSIYCFCLK